MELREMKGKYQFLNGRKFGKVRVIKNLEDDGILAERW